MKITKIEAQVKQWGRYSVFVDEKFAFGLSELGLIDSGLRVGKEVSDAELVELKENSQTDKAYNLALGIIARRPRSEWEIRSYLTRKTVDQVASDEIIQKLISRGYINDEDFARRWVESRRLLKAISRRKLELELRTKRVPDAIIKSVLGEDETNELDVLLVEVDKKRRQPRYQDDAKLMQYLARQGYGYDDIKRALASDPR